MQFQLIKSAYGLYPESFVSRIAVKSDLEFKREDHLFESGADCFRPRGWTN